MRGWLLSAAITLLGVACTPFAADESVHAPSSDAAVLDAKGIDASIDAAPATPDGGGLCPRNALYCQHFTDVVDVKDLPSLTEEGGGAAALVGTVGSADRALRLKMTSLGNARHRVQLSTNLLSTVKRPRVSFQFTANTISSTGLVYLTFYSTATNYLAVFVFQRDGALWLAGYRPPQPTTPPTDPYYREVWVNTLTPESPHTIVMTVDAALEVASASLDDVTSPNLALVGVTVEGIALDYGLRQDPSWTGPDNDVVYDNVVVVEAY